LGSEKETETMQNDITKAMLMQQAMQQFEKLHQPVQADDLIVCNACEEDWPCERMGVILISQALAMLQSMLPSGGMGSLLSRFSSPPR